MKIYAKGTPLPGKLMVPACALEPGDRVWLDGRQWVYSGAVLDAWPGPPIFHRPAPEEFFERYRPGALGSGE
jgi:hypothetical protein